MQESYPSATLDDAAPLRDGAEVDLHVGNPSLRSLEEARAARDALGSIGVISSPEQITPESNAARLTAMVIELRSQAAA